jgi:small subunit ribosomal protein S17
VEGQVVKSKKKILSGYVVSNKMKKTIVVAVEHKKLDRLYKKYVKITKKIKAHDEENTCKEGDFVRVVEHRPISKDKKWKLLEVVTRAK